MRSRRPNQWYLPTSIWAAPYAPVPLLGKAGLFTSLHLLCQSSRVITNFLSFDLSATHYLGTYCCPTAPLSTSISMVGPVLPHRTDRLTTAPYLDRATALPLARTKLDQAGLWW